MVAVDTYAALEPDSALLGQLMPLRDHAAAGGYEHLDTQIYKGFRDLLPLGNRAEDFGVSLRAIESDAAISDQEAYDAFYREIGQPWLDHYHRRFYECRGILREERRRWMAAAPPPVPRCRRHAAEAQRSHPAGGCDRQRRPLGTAPARSSSDSKTSFDAELILDKETGVEKTHHLRVLHERTGAEFEDITFVDDKVNHLVKVAELGVRPVLAGWGFNTDREHELAHELGFEVADLETADEVLFKGE